MFVNNIGNIVFWCIGRVNEFCQIVVSQISNRKSEDKNNQQWLEVVNFGINWQKQYFGVNGGIEQVKDLNGIFVMLFCGIGIFFIDNYIFSIYWLGFFYV